MSTTGRRIPIPGFRLDRRGRLVKDMRKLDVSARIRERTARRCVPCVEELNLKEPAND